MKKIILILILFVVISGCKGNKEVKYTHKGVLIQKDKEKRPGLIFGGIDYYVVVETDEGKILIWSNDFYYLIEIGEKIEFRAVYSKTSGYYFAYEWRKI